MFTDPVTYPNNKLSTFSLFYQDLIDSHVIILSDLFEFRSSSLILFLTRLVQWRMRRKQSELWGENRT